MFKGFIRMKKKNKNKTILKEDLPKTRPALFLDILKIKPAIIVNTSLLTTLFSIPFLVISIFLILFFLKQLLKDKVLINYSRLFFMEV